MLNSLKNIKYQIPFFDNKETIDSQMNLKSSDMQEIYQPLFDAGIHSISMLRRKNNIKNESKRNSFHNFLLLLHGELNVQTGNKKFIQKPGMLTFCPKNHTFSYEGKRDVWLILIHLNDKPIWELLVKHGSYLRHYESTDYMQLLTRCIFKASETPSFNDKLNILEDSRSLVDLIKQEFRFVAERTDNKEDRLSELVEKIQITPETHWTVSEMAKLVHLSPRTLNRLFHIEYGMGPMDFVISKRLDIAVDMLINTNEKIEDISDSLNYKSVYSFSNLFLRHIGMRPGIFRSKNNSKI